MKYTYRFDLFEDNQLQADLNGDNISPGDKVLVYSREDILRGGEEFRISKRFAESGYPGNTDPSVKTFHGWRGTTNDISVYAHGVYSVKSVSREDGEFRGQYLKVVLNRTDLKKNEA